MSAGDRGAERFRALGELLVAMAATPLPWQLFQLVAEQAPMLIPCDFLGLCLADPDGGHRVHTLHGCDGAAPSSGPFAEGAGLAGEAMTGFRTVRCDNLAAYASTCPGAEDTYSRLGLGHALVVPIGQQPEALGALYFAATERPFCAEDGQLAGLLASGLAAGLESARLFQRLGDERGLLAAVLRSAGDGVLVTNAAGAVLLANPAFGKLLDLDADELVGTDLSAYEGLLALRGMLQGAAPAALVELPLPSGGTAQAAVVPVAGEHGEPVGTAALLRDVSLLKEVERVKDELVRSLSHDLKGPLSTLNLAADLIGRTRDKPERQEQVCRQILGAVEYMGSLVTGLSELGKLETATGLAPDTVALPALCAEVCEVLRTDAESRGLRLELETAPVEVTGDAAGLRRLVFNLVGNAIKYTPAGGSVSVTLEQAGEQASLRVADTGVGIPAEALPRVFERFYRVPGAHTKEQPGTGLGLAIAHGIARAHGGGISVASEPGKGSCFTVTLPLRPGTG